ncbi:hypothetical protein RhiXN_02567 [Rhizoctonia solani]|uniref:Uncharacterized protein n=1 Tax=Rhizoctonia solani TaxID=456999 RepID=A0A8H8NRX3_9AGAM|nr:uncharacterized protein RhiXN_02567 [Rhizoctonia solani]QRW17643.1 hypothetical protein RhiXN_02567 [Rhizoctonia solani]
MDDAFADLQLTDPEDDQPEMSSREARIARAFDESKKSYSSETVVTPPGWFQVETAQPPGDLSKLDARHLGKSDSYPLKWSVQRLYLQRSYKQAQILAFHILFAAGVQLDPAVLGDNANGTYGTLPKNEARDRELLDTALRCAIKLNDKSTALALADASRSRWTNNPGLGYTAGEAYIFASRPYEAISALLHAVRLRTPSHQVLSLLARALCASSSATTTTTTTIVTPEAERRDSALAHLGNLLSEYAERTKPAFERGLFPELSEQQEKRPRSKEKANVPPENVVRAWATEAGLGEVDVGLMVQLCCTGDAEEDVGGERSVRTL